MACGVITLLTAYQATKETEMTISEQTKQIVSAQKASIKQKIDANLLDIAEHESAIVKITAINTGLKAQYDALDADIPEPVIVEP